MAKTKQGDVLSCSACGLIVTVDEICGCEETVLVCCDEPMVKGKAAAAKARKKKVEPMKATSKGSAKPATKSVARISKIPKK